MTMIGQVRPAAMTVPSAVKAMPQMGGLTWTSEVVDDLRILAGEGGRSASAIAQALNEKFRFKMPLTRSAIIGKCYRMEIALPGKPSSAAVIEKKPRLRNQAQRRPQQAPITMADGTPPSSLLEIPVGPAGKPIAMTSASRNHLQNAAVAYDAYQQSVIEWMDAVSELAEHAAMPERPGAPAVTIPYWSGNDPKSFWDVDDRCCHYVTGKSQVQGITFNCGDPVGKRGDTMCTWHKRLCTGN